MFCTRLGVTHIREIPARDYQRAAQLLRDNAKRKARQGATPALLHKPESMLHDEHEP
jgi:hypothetical protein